MLHLHWIRWEALHCLGRNAFGRLLVKPALMMSKPNYLMKTTTTTTVAREAQQYAPGTVLHFRDINLRHPSQSVRVISHTEDTIRVQHQSGNAGDWLARDFYDPTCETVNSPARNARKREVRNDCLGLSWEKIESTQGGKLNR